MKQTICTFLIAGLGAVAVFAAAPSAFATDAEACALLPVAEAAVVSGAPVAAKEASTPLPPGAKPAKGFVGLCDFPGSTGASAAQVQGNGPVFYLPRLAVYSNSAKTWKTQAGYAKDFGKVTKVTVPGAQAAQTAISVGGSSANTILVRQGKYIVDITVVKYFDKTGCVDLTPQLTAYAAIAAKNM